jgi:hypothetical protein
MISSNLIIEDTKPEHVSELRNSMRTKDIEEVEKFGFTARRALWRSYKGSVMSRSAIVDGEVAAIWGVGGILLGDVGSPWLLTGAASEKISPWLFAKIYKNQVMEMLDIFPVLENWVDAEYNEAIKLLKVVGFNVGSPEMIGPRKAWFRKYRKAVGENERTQ